jgi:hypothetical protein
MHRVDFILGIKQHVSRGGVAVILPTSLLTKDTPPSSKATPLLTKDTCFLRIPHPYPQRWHTLLPKATPRSQRGHTPLSKVTPLSSKVTHPSAKGHTPPSNILYYTLKLHSNEKCMYECTKNIFHALSDFSHVNYTSHYVYNEFLSHKVCVCFRLPNLGWS